MSSLRAATRATFHRRTRVPVPISSPISTAHAHGRESNRDKQPSLPHNPFMDNAPGWNEDLATPSEAFVKADRETTRLDEMQQKTVDHMRRSSDDPEAEPTRATYARDEVGGPLGNAGVGEFEGVVGNDDLGPDAAQVESDGRVVTRRVPRGKATARRGE